MVTRKTRLMSGLAALLMIVSMFACIILPASAADAVPSTGLYDATALPDIADGYTGATAYQVKDAAGLYALADWVNEEGFSFSGITLYQTADIDLGWEYFPGIGYGHGSTAKRSFNGTYDGNGFIIEGLYVSRQGDSVGTAGLFALVSSGAVIKNVGIASGFVYGRNWVGGVVGRTNGNNCKVYNCWNAATVVSPDGMSAGGVVGSLAGSNVVAANCYNLGLLICNTGKIAGISGWTNNANAVIKNSYNAGQIVGHYNGETDRELACMYDYSPVVVHDYSADRGANFANNYYVKGRGKLGSVYESGLTVVPGTETAIKGTDAATGVNASALTDGTLAAALNGTGLTDAPDGYTIAFENVEGVGYPVLTYRKDGAIAAQRTATATDLVNGDETALAGSALWQLLKTVADGKNTVSTVDMDITLASAADLWLAAFVSGGISYTGTVTLSADIDMADLGIDGLKYYIPFSDGGTFKGTFDGQNHVIKNWSTYAALFDATPRGGLLPYVDGATVKNLGMVDAYAAYDRIAGSGGYLYPALMVEREPSGDQSYTTLTMDNCFAEGTVYCVDLTNVNNFGGVFSTAWGDDITVTGCWTDVDYLESTSLSKKDGHALGKINTAPATSANNYQVFEGDNYKGTDNHTLSASTDLTGVSCKDASLADALNEKMGDLWKFNGEYTTFATSTTVGDPMNNVEAALDLLNAIDPALFTEQAAIEAAIADLKAANGETAAAALATYNALTFTLKEGKYPPISQREAYMAVLPTITDWGIGSYQDFADAAAISVATYYSGMTLHLTNDIDMQNRHADGIGTRHYYMSGKDVKYYGTEFRGTFNGHGYAIKNFASYVNLKTVAEAGAFGRMYKATVSDLSIDGLVKTHGNSDHTVSEVTESRVEPLIGGLAGICSGEVKMSRIAVDVDVNATSFTGGKGITISGIARLTGASNVVDNCYSVGDISGNTGTSSYSGGLSGYSQGQGEYYNSFAAGKLSGKVLGAVRYNGGNKDQYFNNTYAVGYSFDGAQSHATEAQYELAADAYTTGELAYKLNTGFVEGKGTKGYYTLVDNKTVFGTEANQTRMLTIEKQMEDGSLVETIAEYVNAGTVYEIAVPTGYEIASTDLNGYDAEAGTFVMPTSDATLVLKFSGEADALMQNIVDSYAPYIEGHEENFDLFTQDEQMRAAYNAALSVLNGTAEDVPAAVATATENFVPVANLTLKKVYPYYPSLKNIETYKELNTADANGRIHWGIHNVSDWKYLIDDGFNPVDAKYLGSDAATKIGGKDGNYTYIVHVANDIDFNNEEMAPLVCDSNWTLDGHGKVFKNVNVVKTLENATSANYVGLLGGQPWNVIIQNLGMTGSVKVTGTSSAAVYVSSFYGYNGGYSASLFNCWSTADVTLDVTGAGDKIASGLINMRRPIANVTNCYYGGKITSTGTKTAIVWCTEGSSGELYKNVWGAVEGVPFSNITNGASTTAGIVSPEAVASGEIAYLLNNNYSACAFDSYYAAGRPYYDVVDGVTVRVDADPELRKITMKLSGQADKLLFAQDGDVVTLNYVDGATYSIASGNGTLEGDQLTVNGDVEITVDATGILLLDALKEAVAAYEGKNPAYYAENGGETLADVLATANGIIAGEIEAVQPQVDAYVALLGSFELVDAYPNLPKASEMATYPGMTGYLVYDLADLEAVANNVSTFTASQTIYLMDDVTVTAGSAANYMGGLKASINGNNHAIKNVAVDAKIGWLGTYGGTIKNLVMDSWVGTNAPWQGALLVGSVNGTVNLENIKATNCSITTAGANGLSILVGIADSADDAVKAKGIIVENCTMDRLATSGNSGLVAGRLWRGSHTFEDIYVTNNTINGTTNGGGRGIVLGEVTADTAVKNMVVTNTTFGEGASAYGVIGTFKRADDGETGAECTLNVSNVIAVNNNTENFIYKQYDNATINYSGLFVDNTNLVGGAVTEANNNPLAEDGYAAAAFTLNLTSTGYKWEAPAEGVPVLDTDGQGLPLIIYFSATDSDATTNDYTGSLFTNSEGKLVGITNELLEAAYWENADEWETMVFTESTTITGTPIPVHTCVWGNHSHIDGTNTHYAECTWTDGTVECPKTATQDCDFTYDVAPKDSNAAPEEAAHAATCACGNGTGEVLCSDDEENWNVEIIPGDCDTGDMTIYSCDICGYNHIDEGDPKGHSYPETWTKDEVAEGETQTHSHACVNGCGTIESETCTFSGEWVEVSAPTATEAGLKVKYCDKECGATIEEVIPALPSITIDAKNGVAGQTMDVEIVLNNNTGLSGADISVTYDSDVLTLESVTSGDWNLELLGFGPATQPDENGMVTTIVNFAIFADLNTDGTIAVLTFKVAEDAESGDYDFNVEALASTFEGVEYNFAGFDGTVTISDSLRGDINRDNVITIADAVLMLRVANGDTNIPVELDLEAADVITETNTPEMTINTDDVVRVLQYLNGTIAEV